MAAPSLMFEHTLDATKGWFQPAALDFAAKFSSNVTLEYIYGGRVVHVNSDGEFEMGIANTQMAIFLLQNEHDPDVTAEAVTGTVHVAPTGVGSGLVASGAYELESTEFNGARVYAPNELLCADQVNTVLATGGVLDNQDDADAALTVPWAGAGTDQAVCGVVSRGELTNSHGQQALAFWPVYLPGES